MKEVDFSQVLKKLQENGLILKKNKSLRKGLANLILAPNVSEVKQLKSSGMSLSNIYNYLIIDKKIPDFISLRSFYSWYKNICSKDSIEPEQAKIITKNEPVKVFSSENASFIPKIQDSVIPKKNKPDSSQPIKIIQTIDDGYHEEPEINRILAYRAKLLRDDHFMNLSEKCWFDRINYEIEMRKNSDFWNEAIEKETEVEVLEKTRERNFVRCPQKLWTLNPHSPQYPFFAISNYLLYDENGIIYTAKDQLPIMVDFTLYPISFDRNPTFISIDYSLYEKNISIFKLEYKLKLFFEENGGTKFAPVHKLLNL